jgi:quercetin dioxygenase-like cupin family protein
LRHHLGVRIEPAEILDVLRALGSVASPLWLSGGVAVEFLLGRWTRPHKDLDLVAFAPHRGQLERELGARGFALAHDEGWTTRWTAPGRLGADVEVVFVEPASPNTGVLVVPAADPAHGRARRYPFVAGYLDPDRYRELDGVRFRTCSAEGEWLNRVVDVGLVPGRRPQPKLHHDLRLLQSLLPGHRRRKLLQLQSFDANAMPWGELYIDQLKVGVPLKAFVSDPDTGMSVQMIRYAAGFTNPWHRHNCAHGIYVLEGTLKTHAGTFGPGSFVWFPEGMLMEHGATEDADMTALFITNKPFDIRYAFEDEQDGSAG